MGVRDSTTSAAAIVGILLAATFVPASVGATDAPAEYGRVTWWFRAVGHMYSEPPTLAVPATSFERSDEHPDSGFKSRVLEEDLRVALDDSFRLVLEDREAHVDDTFETRIRILLLDAEGDPVVHDGDVVVLADETFVAERAPGLRSDVLESNPRRLPDPFGTGGSVSNGTLPRALDTALRMLCPQGERHPTSFCQNAYGNYGVGTLRPCEPNSALFAGTGAFLLEAVGACGPRSPVNVTKAGVQSASDAAGPAWPGAAYAADRAGEAYNRTARAFNPSPPAPDNWTTFAFAITPHPMLAVDAGAVVIPAGHRLHVEHYVRVGAAWSPPSTQDAYEAHVLPGADAALGLVGSKGHVQVGPTHVEVGLPLRPVNRSTPPLDINASAEVRWILWNNANFERLDELVSNPVPVSSWRYGSADAPSRLEINTVVVRAD